MFNKPLFLQKTEEHQREFLLNFPNAKGFAIDGPNDTELWNTQKTKILFLLKETYGVNGEVCMCMDSLEYNKKAFYKNRTNRNIAKLSYGLMLNKKTVGVPYQKLSPYYANVATIEIKKSTGFKRSYDPTVLKHATFSKDFIKWQISHLKPDIIICCGKAVFKFATKEIFGTKSTESITTIGSTIVINSKHPSAPGYKVDDVVDQYFSYTPNDD